MDELGERTARETEVRKTMGHRTPGARADPELLRTIFTKFKAMAEGTGSRVLDAEDTEMAGDGATGLDGGPLQTLIISGEREIEKLEDADRATQQFQLLDADFLRGDWLARLFYACFSDDAEHELREVAWRYTQLDFLCRLVLKCDGFCFEQKHADDRTCCGVLDPRSHLDLHQVLYPENWNSAYMCPYKTWSEFVRDYNAWGQGRGPKPRWLPKAPVTPKKAAEDVVVVYLICCMAPATRWFFDRESPHAPPLINAPLTEQFLLRGNTLHGTEPVVASVRRCINGAHDRHTGFYETALQMWSRYASFIPGPVEAVVHEQDLLEASEWMRRRWPVVGTQ